MSMTTFLRLTLGILAVLVTLARLPSAQAGECGRLCDPEFWQSATPADVQAELAKGSDLKARAKDGMTPLHWAAGLNKNSAVVTTLLNAGADPKAKTAAGQTAWDLIQKNEKLKDTDAYWRLNDLRYE